VKGKERERERERETSCVWLAAGFLVWMFLFNCGGERISVCRVTNARGSGVASLAWCGKKMKDQIRVASSKY
jgi:hypothetical protein